MRLLLVPFLYMGWCGVLGGIAANFVAADAGNQLSYSIASGKYNVEIAFCLLAHHMEMK